MDTKITCFLRYRIDPWKLSEFRVYAEMWIGLVERFGGTHHGYLLPSEGASDEALAFFSFPSLTAYEDYRRKSYQDSDCQAAFAFAERTRCFHSYQRSFFSPLGVEMGSSIREALS